MKGFIFLIAAISLFSGTLVRAHQYETPNHYIQTSESQANLTPQAVIAKLKDGNTRFLSGNIRNRDYALQIKKTAKWGQAPFAVILSCMDSRGPVETILDQGIGDIFSLRVAGNVINTDNIASIEYATKAIGAKVVIIMGHTHCGAMQAACENVQLGHISDLIIKIKPAVKAIKKSGDSCNWNLVDAIAKKSVLTAIKTLPKQSTILAKLMSEDKILIIGAMQHIETGKVTFFDINGTEL